MTPVSSICWGWRVWGICCKNCRVWFFFVGRICCRRSGIWDTVYRNCLQWRGRLHLLSEAPYVLFLALYVSSYILNIPSTPHMVCDGYQFMGMFCDGHCINLWRCFVMVIASTLGDVLWVLLQQLLEMFCDGYQFMGMFCDGHCINSWRCFVMVIASTFGDVLWWSSIHGYVLWWSLHQLLEMFCDGHWSPGDV